MAAELGARDNFRDNATMSQSRQIVALSLIIRKLLRCCCRKENLSLIFATTDKQIEHTSKSDGMAQFIEEGWRQKPRQNVVVLEWGARSNAALRILV